MIPSLQIFRGIAAVMVIFYHLRLIMAKYFASAVYTEMWVFGRYGVQFFFVLSGFIIFYAHHQELGDRSKIPIYFYKRFVRIFPPYWVVTLLLLPFWIGIADFGKPYHKEFSSLLFSLALLPQAHYPHLSVGWTLVHEILFYAVFATLFLSRKFLAAAIGWAFLIFGYFLSGLKGNYLVDFLMSPNNLLFLFGIAVCLLHQHYSSRVKWASSAMITGIIMYILGGYFVYQNHPYESEFWIILFFGVASGFLVLGSNAPNIEKKFFSSRLLLYLGNASYSIYLVHYPFLSFFAKVVRRVHAQDFLPNIVIWLGLALGAVLAGCIFHELIEKSLITLGRRYLNRKRSSDPGKPLSG